MARSDFNLDSYNTVPERIGEFREKHPDGSLQPVDPTRPFEVVTVGDRVFIAYAAAAYRSENDPRPGIGVAWEPFPGPTPYTRDSELQNAETSAWGRAIVAALAADARKGIATREEVESRRAAQAQGPQFAVREQVEELEARIALLDGRGQESLRDAWRESGLSPLRQLLASEVPDVLVLVKAAESLAADVEGAA